MHMQMLVHFERIGVAQMSTPVIASVDHGVVAAVKRVLMDRDTYAMRWGYGPRASEKKKMILGGLLDKKGRPNENTPKEWLKTEGFLPKLTGEPLIPQKPALHVKGEKEEQPEATGGEETTQNGVTEKVIQWKLAVCGVECSLGHWTRSQGAHPGNRYECFIGTVFNVFCS